MVTVHKSQPPTAPPVYGQPPTQTYSQPPPTGIPVHVHHSPIPSNIGGPNWSSGLCDSCSDCSNYCITCWCPWITFGQIAEIVDKGSSSCVVNGALYCLIAHFTGCAWLYSGFYRSKMRKQYMLAEEPCGDFLVHFCCDKRALCQEYRELKHRGFDMSLGWQGNVEKQNHGVTIAPFAQQGMNR